jgi:hypothetical protein
MSAALPVSVLGMGGAAIAFCLISITAPAVLAWRNYHPKGIPMSNFITTLLAYKKTALAALGFVTLVLTQFTTTFGTEVPSTVTAWITTALALIGTIAAVLGDFGQPASVALKAKRAA